MMVSGGITKDGLGKIEADTCGGYNQREKANSVLCVLCDKWVHGRCAGVKRETTKFLKNLAHHKCEGNIGKAVEQEENYVKWKQYKILHI